MIRPLLIATATLTLASAPLAQAQQPATAPAVPPPAAAPAPATGDKPDAAKARPTDAELRKQLTPEQYRVTCEADTEPAFHNAYWDNHRAGIYVDVISGKPLFSSLDKFDSGTGWPSFTKPITKANVVEHTDRSFGMDRTEVKSKDSNAHLGHLFNDGPAEAGGMRYCMNSASLKFIPVDKLKDAGYSEFLPMFEKAAKEKK